jgi:hypothetical protein
LFGTVAPPHEYGCGVWPAGTGWCVSAFIGTWRFTFQGYSGRSGLKQYGQP